MLLVVHNYYYLLALLLIHSLRTLICVCKYLYMLSTTFNDRAGGTDAPDISVDLTRSRTTFRPPEILHIISRNCYTSQGDHDSSFPLSGNVAWGIMLSAQTVSECYQARLLLCFIFYWWLCIYMYSDRGCMYL